MNNTEDNFKWTPDLKIEFYDYAYKRQDISISVLIERFKKSKQVSMDYEIISLRKYDGYGTYDETTLRSNGSYLNIKQPLGEGFYSLQSTLYDGWKIHSVKRLSDNEVFTIGDKLNLGGNKGIDTLKEIKIDSVGKILLYTTVAGLSFNYATKAKESDNKYVIKNKDCLSINEIMPIVEKGGFIEYRLTLLVKEKINNNG